jgi:hypothetical protein
MNPTEPATTDPATTDLLAHIAAVREIVQAGLRSLTRGPGTPCPPWAADNCDHDADEQVHVGAYRVVTLSLADLHPADDLAPDIYVRLERGFRGADEAASIAMVVKDRYDIELTVTEAADLIGALAGCIGQATGPQQ